jgi:hypothetical protein
MLRNVESQKEADLRIWLRSDDLLLKAGDLVAGYTQHL